MGRQQASKIYKTKRTTRADDVILSEDMASEAALAAMKSQKFDEYLPGLGQHYCVPCAKYCESEVALTTHQKSKVHKRQLKNLRFGPYTPEESVAASGRDVEKFLKAKTAQDELLQQSQVSGEIKPTKGSAHIKQPKVKHTDMMEMEMEMDKEDVDVNVEEADQDHKDGPVAEEITV